MSGKIDDAIIGKRCTLYRGFARVLLEMNVATGSPKVGGDRLDLIGRFEQRWKPLGFFRSKVSPSQNSE
jgi:hypothetical protein